MTNYYKQGLLVGADGLDPFAGIKDTIRKEAAEGAKTAVTPMVIGVGAVAGVALLVALVK